MNNMWQSWVEKQQFCTPRVCARGKVIARVVVIPIVIFVMDIKITKSVNLSKLQLSITNLSKNRPTNITNSAF